MSSSLFRMASVILNAERTVGTPAASLRHMGGRRAECPDALPLDIRGVRQVAAFRDNDLAAQRLPPQDANTELLQYRRVDDLPDLAVGADHRADQRIEIEQERLLNDVDGGDLLRDLVEPHHADIDGTGRDRADDLVIDVALPLFVDFKDDGLVGPLFDLRLELAERHTPQRLGEGDLDGGLQLDLLGGGAARHEQQADESQAKKSRCHRARPPHGSPKCPRSLYLCRTIVTAVPSTFASRAAMHAENNAGAARPAGPWPAERVARGTAPSFHRRLTDGKRECAGGVPAASPVARLPG
jgi:hypothetical protein